MTTTTLAELETVLKDTVAAHPIEKAAQPDVTPPTKKELAAAKQIDQLVHDHSMPALKALAKASGVIVSGSKRAIAEEIVKATMGKKSAPAKAKSEPKPKAPKAPKVKPATFNVKFGDKTYELTPMDGSDKHPYELKDGEEFDKPSSLVLNRNGRPKKFQPMGEVVSNGKTLRKQLAAKAA